VNEDTPSSQATNHATTAAVAMVSHPTADERFSESPVNMSVWITVVSGLHDGNAGPVEQRRRLANLSAIKHDVHVAWQRIICALYSRSADPCRATAGVNKR